MKHVQTVHVESQNRSSFLCEYCEKTYETKNDPVKHIQTVHLEKTNCHQCSKLFLNEETLKMHTEMDHKPSVNL